MDEGQITEFEARITYMENQIKSWQWESSAKIVAFLNIYGKLQASDLRELLGLKGEKSIFKALKVLLDAKKIAKETDSNNPRITYYYSLGEYAVDPKMDEHFITYLVNTQRLDLIAEYFNGANMASVGFIKAMTEIIRNNVVDEKFDRVINFLDNRLFFEAVLSMDDVSTFRAKLAKFLKDEIPKYSDLKPNYKLPLESPVGFYIAFMPI